MRDSGLKATLLITALGVGGCAGGAGLSSRGPPPSRFFSDIARRGSSMRAAVTILPNY
ncbi:MAG: hypothetical protein IID07_11105 [Gemmatimonadetes bacterium]|nr:hypothetical protein [Gemmatimonadota bacterium]